MDGVPTERIVVTGASGFVGANLVLRLLQDHPRARLSLLLREQRGKKAADRAAAILRRPGVEAADRERVEGIDADVSRERCGIAEPAYAALAATATRVIHCAASVQFDEDLAAARQVNVEGTRHVLALAQAAHARGALKRFVYVGTAYVAGERTGLIREDELDMGQRFRNSVRADEVRGRTAAPRPRRCPSDDHPSSEHHRRRLAHR